MRYLICLGLILLSISGHCNDDFNRIFQLVKLRKLHQAQEELQNLKVDPILSKSGEIHFLQGAIYLELYQFRKALIELALAREKYEGASANVYAGHINLYLGRLFKDGFSNSLQARFFLEKAKMTYAVFENYEENTANVNFQMARSYPFSDFEKRTYYNGLATVFFEKNPALYPIELAECYNLNALLFYYQNHSSIVWKEEFLKAIHLVTKNQTQFQINLGKYFDNLGYCLNQEGSNQGITYLKQGLAVNKRFEFNQYWVTSSLNNIGAHYAQKGDVTAALTIFREVVGLRRQIYGDNHPEVALGYQHLGQLFLKQSLIDSAMICYAKAISTMRSPNDSSYNYFYSIYDLPYAFALKEEAELFQEKFKVSHDIKFLKMALENLITASKIIERNYISFEFESSKIAYTSDVRSLLLKRVEVAQQLFGSTKKEEYLVDGLEAMEFLRYTSTLESQAMAHRSFDYPELKSLSTRQLHLKGELAFYKATTLGVNSDRLLKLSKQLFEVSDSIKSLLPSRTEKSANIKSIIETWKNSNNKDVLLEYQETTGMFYIICISSSGKAFIKVNKPSDWKDQLNQLLNLLGNAPDIQSFKQNRERFISNSAYFFDILVKPVENLLTEHSRLVIIPDGSFTILPFELLSQRGENSSSFKEMDYLFVHHEIEYSLSLKLYSTTRAEKRINRVLAFGFTEGSNKLSGVKRELAAIRSNFKMTDREGAECNSSLFLKEASDYSIIHLGIHGQADINDLLRSRLIFSKSDTLFSYQLYSMELDYPLIVLSSCESSLGKAHEGEGIFSMSRAFFSAGAGSVIVTLWKTSDASSSLIFEDFYKSLAKGINSSVSIQRAKLNYLNNSDEFNAHPFFWAGIKPVGVFTPKNELWLPIWWCIMATLLLATLLFYIFYKRHRYLTR